VISISTPGISSLGWPSDLLGRVRVRRRAGLRATEHGPGEGVLANEPQPAPPAREQVLDDFPEVARRGVEGLLERLSDPAIGVPDQAFELAQRRFEILAMELELLDVRHGLGVLGLGERIHRPELLTAAREPLDAPGERCALVVRKRLDGRLGVKPEQRRQALQLVAGFAGVVARLLRADLDADDFLGAALERGVHFGLAGCDRPELGRQSLPHLPIGFELLAQRGHPAGHRERGRLQRRDHPGCDGLEPLVGGEAAALLVRPPHPLLALALRAGDEPALRVERRLELRPALGRRPFGRGPAPLLQEPARVALGFDRLVVCPLGFAPGAVRLFVGRLGSSDVLRGPLGFGQRELLGLDRPLRFREQLVAPVALGEHPVLPARRDLTQLTGHGRPHAPAASDRHAREAGGDFLDRLDHPDPRELPADELRDPRIGMVAPNPVGEQLGARRRRLRERGAGFVAASRLDDERGTAVAAPAV
jgi:hypothetical protein